MGEGRSTVKSQTYSFKVDAAIIARLGEELVARQETALMELIKNAYDADATAVDVTFIEQGTDRHLEISDNGSGMTRDDLLNGFLRLASDTKAQQPTSPKFGRRRAGKKGIGRFAAQRLGRKLLVRTATASAEEELTLTVNWDDFSAGRSLEEVEVRVSGAEKQKTGTTIRVEFLRDGWTEHQFKQAWRGVLAIQQPFPVAPVFGDPARDPGFQVRIYRTDGLFADEALVTDIKSEVLAHSHAVIEMSVDGEGNGRWRIVDNRFGLDLDWQPLNADGLQHVQMKAYYFVLDSELIPKLVFGRLRQFLNEEGGIRLYRNGFRVVPYGEPDDDWLGLVSAYNKRSELAPFANKNFFGVVEMGDAAGFEEHTSREGLIRSPEFDKLTKLASSVLITAATRLAVDRGRKPRAGRAARPSIEQPVEVVRHALRSARLAAEDFLQTPTPDAAERVVAEAALAERVLEERAEEIEAAKTQLSDESAMLRFLAALGMTVAEFSHETGMSFDAFRLDLNAVFEKAEAYSQDDKQFSSKLARAREMVGRLDTLTSYLNSLASARSARTRVPQSLRRAVEEFERGVREQANSQGVVLLIETPEFEPLETEPLHSAELASILLNLYTNAVKAMKREGGERRVSVTASRTDKRHLRLKFQDTGDGIPRQNWDRIFRAFFTTTAAPAGIEPDDHHARGTGLGLWIVAQVVENAGGRIAVVDADEGFATCIQVDLPSRGADA